MGSEAQWKQMVIQVDTEEGVFWVTGTLQPPGGLRKWCQGETMQPR